MSPNELRLPHMECVVAHGDQSANPSFGKDQLEVAADRFARDGAVCLRGVFDPACAELVARGIARYPHVCSDFSRSGCVHDIKTPRTRDASTLDDVSETQEDIHPLPSDDIWTYTGVNICAPSVFTPETLINIANCTLVWPSVPCTVRYWLQCFSWTPLITWTSWTSFKNEIMYFTTHNISLWFEKGVCCKLHTPSWHHSTRKSRQLFYKGMSCNHVSK